jgi:hypothetical protein
MKLGIEKTAMVRVRADISYALTEAMDDGHCGLPTDELLSLAERLLEVPVELVRTALDLELADGTVVADTVGETACVFLAGLHRAERNIADRMLGLSGGSLRPARCPWFASPRCSGRRPRAASSPPPTGLIRALSLISPHPAPTSKILNCKP